MPRRPWAGRDVLAVLARYAGEGPGSLAHDLGRSPDAVSSLARRYGQRTPRKPYRRDDRRGRGTP
jgi:hypothetical protein